MYSAIQTVNKTGGITRFPFWVRQQENIDAEQQCISLLCLGQVVLARKMTKALKKVSTKLQLMVSVYTISHDFSHCTFYTSSTGWSLLSGVIWYSLQVILCYWNFRRNLNFLASSQIGILHRSARKTQHGKNYTFVENKREKFGKKFFVFQQSFKYKNLWIITLLYMAQKLKIHFKWWKIQIPGKYIRQKRFSETFYPGCIWLQVFNRKLNKHVDAKNQGQACGKLHFIRFLGLGCSSIPAQCRLTWCGHLQPAAQPTCAAGVARVLLPGRGVVLTRVTGGGYLNINVGFSVSPVQNSCGIISVAPLKPSTYYASNCTPLCTRGHKSEQFLQVRVRTGVSQLCKFFFVWKQRYESIWKHLESDWKSLSETMTTLSKK